MGFGNKSTSRWYQKPVRKKSWKEKKEECEGAPGGEVTPAVPKDNTDRAKVKSEDLDALRNPRGPCTLMDAARTVTLESTLEGVPSDWSFIRFKDVSEYNRISYDELKRYKVAIFKAPNSIFYEYYRPKYPDKACSMLGKCTVSSTYFMADLFADFVMDIFWVHTPLYRERIRNILNKFTVSRNTISNVIKTGTKMFSLFMIKLKSKLLKVKSVLNIDETWIKIRIKLLNDGTKLDRYYKKYIWAIVNRQKNIVYFFYDNDENDSCGCCLV